MYDMSARTSDYIVEELVADVTYWREHVSVLE
jgi:hypothetical protein